jgi:hypothetical protein
MCGQITSLKAVKEVMEGLLGFSRPDQVPTMALELEVLHLNLPPHYRHMAGREQTEMKPVLLSQVQFQQTL